MLGGGRGEFKPLPHPPLVIHLCWLWNTCRGGTFFAPTNLYDYRHLDKRSPYSSLLIFDKNWVDFTLKPFPVF
ncbi:hypothetical protein NIES39_Q00100 [Arthrospira platensis NIES-39]|nr:hypothetical protein NIES39_Q00100 [Arthrospira platensis NIES-39]